MNTLYVAIYWLNKVMPRLAKRAADYFFPVCPWEAEHDLANAGWAEADVFNAAQDDWATDHLDDCMACLEPERYDDHLYCERDEWLV